MKVLNKDELQTAEEVLQKHLPHSFQVYGFLYAVNKNIPSTLEFIVDTWPHFKVIVCRTPLDYEGDQVSVRTVSFYSTDDQSLRKMLMEGNGFDWSTTFRIGGFDVSQLPIVKEVSSVRAHSSRCEFWAHLWYLPDSSHLLTPEVDRELESRISSLNLSHADLVNQTCKLGGHEKGYRYIRYLISNYPSYGITDDQGQLLSWILLRDYFSLGFLYTLPGHRRKGYARAVAILMVKRLLAEGHPVFTFTLEENKASYGLFKSLGFIEDPPYRAAWFNFNF